MKESSEKEKTEIFWPDRSKPLFINKGLLLSGQNISVFSFSDDSFITTDSLPLHTHAAKSGHFGLSRRFFCRTGMREKVYSCKNKRMFSGKRQFCSPDYGDFFLEFRKTSHDGKKPVKLSQRICIEGQDIPVFNKKNRYNTDLSMFLLEKKISVSYIYNKKRITSAQGTASGIRSRQPA